jgi:hypothetical protein
MAAWRHSLLTTAALLCIGCSFEPTYKAELRAFEKELSDRGTVTCIQAWMPARAMAVKLDEYQWPACVKELRPLAVQNNVDGGVGIMVQRGEVFWLVVYPPGRRPQRNVHEPSQQQPGYLGFFGNDAYIGVTES